MKKTVRRLLAFMFSNKLAREVNWVGKRGKLAFSKLKLKDILISKYSFQQLYRKNGFYIIKSCINRDIKALFTFQLFRINVLINVFTLWVLDTCIWYIYLCAYNYVAYFYLVFIPPKGMSHFHLLIKLLL